MELSTCINMCKSRHWKIYYYRFNNEITFIIPNWTDFPEGKVLLTPNEQWTIRPTNISEFVVFPEKSEFLSLLEAWARSEFEYNSMIRDGLQPQQAREVLPLATKSELVMTGFMSDWRHFFDLRLFEKTGKVHPDMLDIAIKAKRALEENSLWEYIMSQPSKFD